MPEERVVDDLADRDRTPGLAQAECRRIETEFDLRPLKPGDLTAPRTPTGAERAKAERQGQTVTARQWLRERAYAVAAAVHTEADYFTVLQSLGIKVKTRLGPKTGDVIGYSLAAPGGTSAGGPVRYGGSKLAPDISINRLRERLPDQEMATAPGTWRTPPPHGGTPPQPSTPHASSSTPKTIRI